MNVQPSTDITVFAGRRVQLGSGQHARVFAIRHGAEAVHQVEALRDGVWGDCWYERHGGDPGGNSSFWWPYGTDLTVVS